MMVRKRLELTRVLNADGELDESVTLDSRLELAEVESNSPQTFLDGNLPEGRGAYRDIVVSRGDHFPRSFGKLSIAGQPPEQDMRIEQQSHGRSFSKRSAGSDSSKSRAIRTRPRIRPGFRFAVA